MKPLTHRQVLVSAVFIVTMTYMERDRLDLTDNGVVAIWIAAMLCIAEIVVPSPRK